MTGPRDSPAADTGAAFLASRLDVLAQRVASGEPCVVVFDLDNTLFDTRARTLHAARSFDRARGSSVFASMTLSDVARNAEETCARWAGVSPETARDFANWWKVEFWSGPNFVHDIPMTEVLAWVQRAHAAGGDVRFLTGRIEALRDVTLQQLHRAGLDWLQSEHVWMKPDLRTWTLAYKAAKLREIRERGWLGWYVTEGRTEIAHLQRELPDGPWVLLASSIEGDVPEVASDTPTLAKVF